MGNKILLEIDPLRYPRNKGESWWIVHPNYSKCEFRIPEGGVAICMASFMHFRYGVAYGITANDASNGWITISSSAFTTKMPYYIFARYFDAEAFIRGIVDPMEFDKACSFNRKPMPYFNVKFDDTMPKGRVELRDEFDNVLGALETKEE